MPQISIIIPVYKTEKYLRECLDSVLAQTFQDIEIICVNDGSPDNASIILEEYRRKDSRIKIVTQDNQGLSAARNAGLSIASGRYVFFLDSDDTLPSYSLEVLYNIAVKTGAEIVVSRAFGNTNPTQDYVLHQNHVFSDFVVDRKIFSSAANKLYEAKLFAEQRFTSGMLFEDWPLITILFGQISSYATTEVPCYIYREDGVSITRSGFTTAKIDGYLCGIKIVYDFFKNSSQLALAQKRMVVALKMCVNKVYHAHDKQLARYLVPAIDRLFERKILLKHQLPLKTRWRLWCLKHL